MQHVVKKNQTRPHALNKILQQQFWRAIKVVQDKREDLSGINNGLEDRKQQFGTNYSFSEGGEFTSTGTSKINAGTNVVQ